jgi:MATE family multidrug resistance protein
LGRDGTAEELVTTARQEAKLLFKYSVPLMGTYLLQYSFSLVTIFVVGHSKCLPWQTSKY